jgi:hypothetical protein
VEIGAFCANDLRALTRGLYTLYLERMKLASDEFLTYSPRNVFFEVSVNEYYMF